MASGTSTGSTSSNVVPIIGIIAVIVVAVVGWSYFNGGDKPDPDEREHVLTLWVEWRPNDDIPVVVTHTIRGQTTGPQEYFDSPWILHDTFQEGDVVTLTVAPQDGRELLDCIIMVNDEPVARQSHEDSEAGCNITHTGWVPLAGWEPTS